MALISGSVPSAITIKAHILSTHMCIHWVHSASMKDAGLRIRVQRDLREKFLAVCRAQDKPAAQVLREFMREYVIEHEAQLPDADDDSDRAARDRSKAGNGQS